MPVTRSATRAAARSTRSRRVQVNPIEFTKTAKTTKAKTVKAKTKQPDTLSATRAVSLNYVSPRGRLLEWISLKDLAGGVAPDNGTLFGILQELCRQKGCQVVARGRPHELSGMEWLIIGKSCSLGGTKLPFIINLTNQQSGKATKPEENTVHQRYFRS